MSIIVKLPIFLTMVYGSFAFSAQAAPQANGSETSGEKVDRGLENVKQGTKEAAEGISNAASEATDKATSAGRKVGMAIKAATCPVVGDRKSKRYYAKDSKSYAAILDGQKFFEDDDRACFMSEESARNEGYTRNSN